MKKKKLFFVLTFTLFLLVLSNMHSAVSEWTADKALPANCPLFDGAASVIQTSDGKIWVVWEKTVLSGQAIFYTTSSDYGLSWSDEKNLTVYPNQDENIDPSIVQLSNGTILVVWAARKVEPPPPPEAIFNMSAAPNALSIKERESGNSTITVTSLNEFSDPVDLSVRMIFPPEPEHNITTSFDPPQVTPPPDGEATSTLTINVGNGTIHQNYVITVQGYSALFKKANSTSVIVTVKPPSGSSAASETSSPLTSSQQTESDGNYKLYYKVSHDDGNSWSNEMQIPVAEHPDSDLAPSIMQASNGTIWLAWSSTRTANSTIFYKTSPDFGASWSDDIPLTPENFRDLRPNIAQMQDGRIWVTWHSHRFGDQEILYNIYDGISWFGDTRLTTHPNMDLSPAILQLANGTIRIFWSSCASEETANADLYYKESNNNGGSWSDRVQVTTDANEDVWPAVTQSVDTRIWAVWTSNRTGTWDIYYKTSFIHNIAVLEITPSDSQVYQEEIVSIDVKVQNFGDYDETFTLNCYINSTLIDAQSVTLNATKSIIMNVAWNTTDFTPGNYQIKVNASIVEGEAYAVDNTQTHENTRVKFLGDVDDNGVVNVFDTYALCRAYNSAPGDAHWNEEADMNGDDVVNSLDLSALIGNYGRRY